MHVEIPPVPTGLRSSEQSEFLHCHSHRELSSCCCGAQKNRSPCRDGGTRASSCCHRSTPSLPTCVFGSLELWTLVSSFKIVTRPTPSAPLVSCCSLCCYTARPPHPSRTHGVQSTGLCRPWRRRGLENISQWVLSGVVWHRACPRTTSLRSRC